MLCPAPTGTPPPPLEPLLSIKVICFCFTLKKLEIDIVKGSEKLVVNFTDQDFKGENFTFIMKKNVTHNCYYENNCICQFIFARGAANKT